MESTTRDWNSQVVHLNYMESFRLAKIFAMIWRVYACLKWFLAHLYSKDRKYAHEITILPAYLSGRLCVPQLNYWTRCPNFEKNVIKISASEGTLNLILPNFLQLVITWWTHTLRVGPTLMTLHEGTWYYARNDIFWKFVFVEYKTAKWRISTSLFGPRFAGGNLFAGTRHVECGTKRNHNSTSVI
jgi:hypothetical protein